MQRDKRVKKGFTLLEILLVIAAIGILAAIVLVAINPTKQIAQVRTAAINSEKNTIEKAITQRLIDTGTYPTLIDGVQRRICSSTVTTDCINITADIVPTYIAAIPTGAIYTASKSNDGRININMAETLPSFKTCPTGYIRVPGNNLYQTKDFCVMKYEAKAVSTTDTTTGLTTPNTGLNTIANNTTATTAANNRAIASVASGFPIANINQTTAASYCTTAGASLITNTEWMTIARNIEAQSSNWRNGVVGSTDASGGGLYRGHSDNSPSNALTANTNDSLGYEGTENASETPVSRERRTHTLSNGEIIWDLSGNAWEWTNDTIMGVDKPNNSSGAFFQEWTAISNFRTLSYDLTRPSNKDWAGSQNMGPYRAGELTGGPFAFLRGGRWTEVPAGVFHLTLNATSDITNTTIGFRCVIR